MSTDRRMSEMKPEEPFELLTPSAMRPARTDQSSGSETRALAPNRVPRMAHLAKFANALGTLTGEQADTVCAYLRYYATEADVSPIKYQLSLMQKSSQLTAKQKAVVEKLIETFK